MIQSRTENTLQSRMYRRQQTADTVAALRCLCSNITIEAAEHVEFGDDGCVGASVLASPVCRLATATGNALMVAGWSTTSSI